MNKLQVFENTEFGSVQMLMIGNIPYFMGKDSAEILGYSNTAKAIRDHVDEDDKLTERIVLSGQNRDVIFINESGLYALILSSKMPNAKKFKRWVTNEVLPSIRKNGAYLTEEKAQAVVNGNGLADLLIQAGEQIKRLEMDRQTMLPKVKYFDDLVDRHLLTNFRDTAKVLKIKERQFIKWLLSNHYVYRDQKNVLKPYAQYNQSLFEMKEQKTEHWEGTQTLITPKGRETFHLLLGGVAHD